MVLPGTDAIFSTSKTWKMMICVAQVGNNAGKNKIPNLTTRLYFNVLFSLEPFQRWLVTKTKNCNFMNHSSGSVFLFSIFFFLLHSNSVSFNEAVFLIWRSPLWSGDHLSLYVSKKNIWPKPCVDDDEAQVESSAGEDRADIKSVCVSLLSLCPAVLRRLFKKKKGEEEKGGKKLALYVSLDVSVLVSMVTRFYRYSFSS